MKKCISLERSLHTGLNVSIKVYSDIPMTSSSPSSSITILSSSLRVSSDSSLGLGRCLRGVRGTRGLMVEGSSPALVLGGEAGLGVLSGLGVV